MYLTVLVITAFFGSLPLIDQPLLMQGFVFLVIPMRPSLV
jgi:hypothetical protein